MKRLLALLFALALSGCAATATPQTASRDFFAMDTLMRVTVHGQNAEQLATQTEQTVTALESILSRTKADSELSLLNQANGAPTTLSDEALDAVSQAMALYRQTEGYFDPTILLLSTLWNVTAENPVIPTAQQIEAALQTIGGDKVKISGNTVTLTGGAMLDLGGFAKGLAANKAAQLLYDAKAEGLIVLGGNVYAVGSNDGKDWRIGIANPDNSSDVIASVSVRDLSVVTSGDYERYFIKDGVRYHHIFDPKTGYPAQSGLRSVSVVDKDSAKADALCTALYVMGYEQALAYCTENQIAAAFVTEDKQVYTTKKLSEICSFSFLGAEKGYSYAG